MDTAKTGYIFSHEGRQYAPPGSMTSVITLLALPPVNGLAANGLATVCISCYTTKQYDDAVRATWMYDPHGKPFEAYYCAECQQSLRAKEIVK